MKNGVNKIFSSSGCPAEDLLHRYHAGTLSAEQHRLVELHLASCEACSDELEGMSLMDKVSMNAATIDLNARVHAKLAAANNTASISLLFKVAAAVIILFVVSFVLYFIINSNQSLHKNDIALHTQTEKHDDSKQMIDEVKAVKKETTPPEEQFLSGKSAVTKKSGLMAAEQSNAEKIPVQKSSRASVAESTDLAFTESEKTKTDVTAGYKTIEKLKEEPALSGSGEGTTSVTASGKGVVMQTIVTEPLKTKTDEQTPVVGTTVADNRTLNQKTDDADKNIIAGNKNTAQSNMNRKEEERANGGFAANVQQATDAETKSGKKSSKDQKKKSLEKSETGKDGYLAEAKADKGGKNQVDEDTGTRVEPEEKARKKAETDAKAKAKDEAKAESKKSKSPEKELTGENTIAPAGSGDNAFSNGLEKYHAGKYSEAISFFQQVLDKNPSDFKALYYQGLCYFESEKASIAVNCFEMVLNMGNNNLTEDARWYLALSQIKLKNADAARKTLDDIIKKDGKYKTKAKQKKEEVH